MVWSRSYIIGRFQAVLITGFSSMHTIFFSIIPQGSVLGPLLFLIFINDLSCILLDSIMWLLADDVKLNFISINFNDDLVRFYNWNQANGMLVNAKKSLCISFCDFRAHVRARQHHNSATRVQEGSQSLCQRKFKMEHAHSM